MINNIEIWNKHSRFESYLENALQNLKMTMIVTVKLSKLPKIWVAFLMKFVEPAVRIIKFA